MQRLCARCRHAIEAPTRGELAFCPHCGSPQVELSEDLLEQSRAASEAFAAAEAEAATPASIPAEPDGVNWRGAMQLVLLAGAVAIVLELASIPVVPLDFLAMLWMLGAPVVTLGVYASRFRTTRITAMFGSRLGLLCGISVSLGILLVHTGQLLLSRYVFHSAAAADFDATVNLAFANARAAAMQQSGPAIAPTLAALDWPEFRAGMAISVTAFCMALYLAFSTVGGAFAGMLRARKPQA